MTSAAEQHHGHRVHDLQARPRAEHDERQPPARSRRPRRSGSAPSAPGRPAGPRTRTAPERCPRGRARPACRPSPGLLRTSQPNAASRPSIAAEREPVAGDRADHQPAHQATAGGRGSAPAPAANCGWPPGTAGTRRAERRCRPRPPVRCRPRRRCSAAAPRRGTPAAGPSPAGWPATSAVMSAIGRLPMPATMSIRRETASRRMTDGVSAVRTSATSPSRTVPPPGRSISRFWMSSMLRRVDGTPCTITSKTFWSSNRLPTWMPWTSVASARRTSPGVMPTAWAFSRSTSISIVDCIVRLDQLRTHAHRRHPRRHRGPGWRSARG